AGGGLRPDGGAPAARGARRLRARRGRSVRERAAPGLPRRAAIAAAGHPDGAARAPRTRPPRRPRRPRGARATRAPPRPRPGRRAARARLGDLRSCPRRGLGPSRRRHPARARGPRMIRPATTTLVLAGLCGALACGGRSADRAAVELWAMGREGEVVRGLVPDFERLNPDVRVRVQQIPWSAAHEKLLTAFVGGAMPDVFQAGNTWLPELAALGAIEPLDAP